MTVLRRLDAVLEPSKQAVLDAKAMLDHELTASEGGSPALSAAALPEKPGHGCLTMPPPADPKIYHIVHVDRLPSIIADGWLWCDEDVVRREAMNPGMGTTIGMTSIKQRRLTELTLRSHPGLYVGQCVPFYFCPRSVMLYLIYRANHPELVVSRWPGTYRSPRSRPPP